MDDPRVFEDASTLIYKASIWVLPAITAITLHEAAHGWVAWKLETIPRGAWAGQLQPGETCRSLRHPRPAGLLLMMKAPFLFGYAKPVPVDFARLRQPKRDMIWVAAAGPGINLLMAYLAALLLYVTIFVPDVARPWLFQNFKNALLLNIVLAVFNMLPLPPLDGGRIVLGLLPPGLAVRYAKLERYGMAIIVGLLFVPPLIGTMIDTAPQHPSVDRVAAGGNPLRPDSDACGALTAGLESLRRTREGARGARRAAMITEGRPPASPGAPAYSSTGQSSFVCAPHGVREKMRLTIGSKYSMGRVS